jgi:3-phosphoshikimate 1-carboxyvinyltransferase
VHRTALGEPVGEASASYSPLHAVTMGGENLVRAGAEIHVLAALAARAQGETLFADLGALFGQREALRRAAEIVAVLRAFGVRAEPVDDGLVIEGRPEGPLRAADVDGEGNPGVAAAATLLGLSADGPTRIEGFDALARRFPRLAGTLRALGVDARVERRTV